MIFSLCVFSISILAGVNACLCGRTCLAFLWHGARRCRRAAPPSAPFILSKTSKLPSSAVHEGAALCLMSLLFCSDLPPPKSLTAAQTHTAVEIMEKHCDGETSGACRCRGLKPRAASKLTSAAFSRTNRGRRSFILLSSSSSGLFMNTPPKHQITIVAVVQHISSLQHSFLELFQTPSLAVLVAMKEYVPD